MDIIAPQSSIRLFAFLTLIMMLCISTDSLSSEVSEFRVIVRFTNEVTGPRHDDMISSLSQTAGVDLDYLKVLSGRRNTHLYRATTKVKSCERDKVIKLLSQRGDVIYAEEDMAYQANQ